MRLNKDEEEEEKTKDIPITDKPYLSRNLHLFLATRSQRLTPFGNRRVGKERC